MSSSDGEINELKADGKKLNKKFEELNLSCSNYGEVLKEFEQNKNIEFVGENSQALKIDLNTTLRGRSLLNVSDNSEVWGYHHHQDYKSENMEECVRQLAELEIRRGEAKPGEVLRNCSNIIVKFDKMNLINFLSSVKLALDVTPREADKATVLEYAKQRVTGNVAIASSSFERYDDFKNAIMLAFKPKRSVTEMESIIGALTQKEKETVDEFGKRVSEIKFEYELASQAERLAEGAKLDEIRLKEMERKISRAFVNGLKDHVIRFVGERPQTLTEAISVALEAESTSNVRYKNRKMTEQTSTRKITQKHNSEKSSGKSSFPKGNGKFQKNAKENVFKKKSNIPISEVECYNCNEKGHYKTDCPKLANETQSEAKTLNTRTSQPKRKNEASTSKNGETRGASVSAKSLKIRSLH